jgi:hypothetical protein
MYITTSSIKNEDSSPEYLLYLEHNKIRQNPSSYIPILKEVLKMYRTKNILHFYNEHPFKTYEGRQLALETISFLENQKSVNSLIYSQPLSISSHNHAVDLGTHNLNSHIGSNNLTLRERVEKYTEWNGLLIESIEFGINNPEYIICKLIMCDGIKERFQRLNVFNEHIKYIGIGICKHVKYGNVIVINYAMELRKIGDSLNAENFISQYLDTTFYFNYMKKDLNEIKKVKSIKKDKNYFLNDSHSSSFNLSQESEYSNIKSKIVLSENTKKKNNEEKRKKFKRRFTRKRTVQASGDEKKLIYNIDNNIVEQMEISESSNDAAFEEEKESSIKEEINESYESEESDIENSFTIDNYIDLDIPENVVEKDYKLIIKTLNGVKIHIIQKIYTLNNGKVHIIESEYKPNKII